MNGNYLVKVTGETTAQVGQPEVNYSTNHLLQLVIGKTYRPVTLVLVLAGN